MKITEMILSAILKKGLLFESKNVSADIEIPDTKIKVHVEIENMTLRFEREG